MNLQIWTMESLENGIIQIISFHITWFIYKKLTRSSLAYWKVLFLSLLGVVVSLAKGDGFYYQVIVFLSLALKERREHRLTLWASFFFGAFSVIFTDLFATFTPFYVFNNLFTNMTLVEIQENFLLKLLSYVMIYPFFLYINYLSSLDIDKIKELIYSRGRERLLIAVDLTFALYITCSMLLVSTGRDVGGPIFIAMAVYLLMVTTLNRYSHKFVRERSKEVVETYVYNLEVYNQHIEDLFTKVKPIEKDFENLLVALETPLAKNQLSEVLSVYHEHLNHLKLDNLDLNDKLAPLFEIPYPVLRSWIVNQIIPLEQKGITVRLDVNVGDYPKDLNIAVLITVLERCIGLAEMLWAKEPDTDIGFLIHQNEDGNLSFVIENTNQEANPELDDSLSISRNLAQFCWSNGIGLTNKKELFKTYQIVTVGL